MNDQPAEQPDQEPPITPTPPYPPSRADNFAEGVCELENMEKQNMVFEDSFLGMREQNMEFENRVREYLLDFALIFLPHYPQISRSLPSEDGGMDVKS
jgi:hypothetical protein